MTLSRTGFVVVIKFLSQNVESGKVTYFKESGPDSKTLKPKLATKEFETKQHFCYVLLIN